MPPVPFSLRPLALTPLPPGAIRPTGWLLDQCRVQAAGLTGHLEEYWPDLGPDNMWLGGRTEGWERGPYYLDGLIPLAHVLDDARLKAMAQRWIDSILSMCREDGWIGPAQAPDRKEYDVWPVAIVLKALTQHADATGDPRVEPAVAGFARWLAANLPERPLYDWMRHRWHDLALSLEWLYARAPDEALLGTLRAVHADGYDWRAHFERFRFTGKTALGDCTLDTHVVNNAMAVKAGGVAWRFTGDDGDLASVYRTLEMLDRHHGQATGIFSGDEHYAGREPVQGTELCAVVEEMFSLEMLLAIQGDAAFGDRLERIAYNALPGTFTPDMWAHQYDQQANQVLCTVAKRAWTNNDDDSNTFGLEPNFGCCTANLHQGWPKLVTHLWMHTPDGGLAAAAWAPCVVRAELGRAMVEVETVTEYPFRTDVDIHVRPSAPARFPLRFRVPAWAAGATVAVAGGEPAAVAAGSWHTVEREWRAGDTLALRFPAPVRSERREHGAATLLRGPLVFSLRIGEEFRVIKGTPPRADYEVLPTTPWNYALAPSEADPASAVTGAEERPVSARPYDPAAPPVTLRASARRLPEWGMEQNSAGPTPESPVSAATPVETVELIPYGSAHLRITEFPVAADTAD